jgi:hypothetical protein
MTIRRLPKESLAPTWLALVLVATAPVGAQSPDARRNDARPALLLTDDFEGDEDDDGVPDGWYNPRDVTRARGGQVGRTCLRFENVRPGRPARISRAFGVDGASTEALRVGLWVRVQDVLSGERMGEDPSLMIDLLGDDVRAVGRRTLGPWAPATLGEGWCHVARRLSVPLGTRDAILTVGLLGATGTLEIDGLTVEAIPRGGEKTTSLLLNGDFELGDRDPSHWVLEGGARRASPGRDSDAALELTTAGARAMAGLSVPVGRFTAIEARLAVRARGLRVTGGAAADIFFLDDVGRTLPAAGGTQPFRWGGTFDWRPQRAVVEVPRGATRAVFQVEKVTAGGSVEVDNVQIEASPSPEFGSWTPYHEQDEVETWKPYEPASGIEPGSSLDASALLDAPAGKAGRVVVRQSHLAFEQGGRARFFGVTLLPPTAFLDAPQAEALVDRLARSGVNLVRFSDLDTPLGPGVSLYDDARDDTASLDAGAMRRLDHLIALLKKRGIYIALELQAQRRFREKDGLADVRRLAPAGGAAAAFDPDVRKRAVEAARLLLEHVNPETGKALKDEPALAWVTLAGERSLFNLIDAPGSLLPRQAKLLRKLAEKLSLGSGRRAWQAIESDQWTAESRALRDLGLKAPIAGSSHWRREPEFGAAQAATGLDLIDDRIYWRPSPWGPAERRSLLWDIAGGLTAPAGKKRRTDRPYVVGEWASHTGGAWALPFEAADLILAARTAAAEDWDALVRRGVYLHPQPWGAAAPGTGGSTDVFPVPEVINAIPPVFALLPHAASLILRSHESPVSRSRTLDLKSGRLAIETAHTVVLAGFDPGSVTTAEGLGIEIESEYAVVAVSSAGAEPINRARRLLVTAVGRAQPTGLSWVDGGRREVADPGRPPILLEPIRAAISWKHRGTVEAYALDGAGKRSRPVTLGRTADGIRLDVDTKAAGGQHWELVVR